MKKYLLSSLVLVGSVTLLCGLLLPLILSMPLYEQERTTVQHERKCYFEAKGEPYLLIEDACLQAEKIAIRRNLRVDKVRAMIMKKAIVWPLDLFPSCVNVNELNHELDWPQ